MNLYIHYFWLTLDFCKFTTWLSPCQAWHRPCRPFSCRSNPFYEPKTSSPPRLLAGGGVDTDVVSVQKRRAPAPPSASSGHAGPLAASRPGPVPAVVGSVQPAGSGPVAAVMGRELASSSSSPKVTVTCVVCWLLVTDGNCVTAPLTFTPKANWKNLKICIYTLYSKAFFVTIYIVDCHSRHQNYTVNELIEHELNENVWISWTSLML